MWEGHLDLQVGWWHGSVQAFTKIEVPSRWVTEELTVMPSSTVAYAFSIWSKMDLVNSCVVALPPMSRVRDLLHAVSECTTTGDAVVLTPLQ